MMLKITVTQNRVSWTWQVAIFSLDEGFIFSRIAHNLNELSQILLDAAAIVAQEAAKEGAQ